MKTTSNQKNIASSQALTTRKQGSARTAAKAFEHRYERRKIREQLRHLDWALAD
jgi:hypothetical protein